MQPTRSWWVRKGLLAAAVGYTGLISWGALTSVESLSGISLINLPVSDKAVHFIAYFGLGLLWFTTLYFYARSPKSHRKLLLGILACGFVYGIVIELFQTYGTETRRGEWQDALANLSGLSLAVVILTLFEKKLSRLKNKLLS